ncbi:MAG: DoxX family protein [Saprospiraceae bacterium]
MLELYRKIRRNEWLNLFVILTRILIGTGFTFASFPKILGLRFTQISVDTPIGYFFEAMYQTGIYWNFLGWSQLIAAFLLMTQRFSTLGAIIFFPIIVNIFLITYSLSFPGTIYITFLMLLATILLLVWDFEKLKYIFFPDNFKVVDDNFRKPTYNNFWIATGVIIFINTVLSAIFKSILSLTFGNTIIMISALIGHFIIRRKNKRLKT